MHRYAAKDKGAHLDKVVVGDRGYFLHTTLILTDGKICQYPIISPYDLGHSSKFEARSSKLTLLHHEKEEGNP